MKKLSELTTLQGVKVLGRLTTEINRLATNQTFKDKCLNFVEKHSTMTKGEQIFFFMDMVLNDYPEVVFQLLAIIQDKDVKEIEEQSIITTLEQVEVLKEDKDLINFFTSFTKKGQKT